MFKQEKKYYRDAFLLSTVMGFMLLLPFTIKENGIFILYSDYNAQQIPFYKHCVEMVRNGTLGWDWQTDIGANFVGSYSGMLANPFFWIMCLFPSNWAPYFMMPFLSIKFGLFGLLSFMYIRRFVTKPQSAIIGAILYAFSGFTLHNTVYQCQDWILWFPLLLIGLEEAVINKRRGVFALAIAINCFLSYFFFIQECVFLILYFVIRCLADPKFSINVLDFFCLAFESIVGVLITGVLFLPSIYQVLDVPRVQNTLLDWDFIFYNVVQRYGLILESIFFPPELVARSEMFPYAASKWASVAVYLPLFSTAGVIALFKSEKKHWVRILLLTCLVFAFIPGLNASFTMFNKQYYARWYFMPTLICCLATAITLDREEYDFKYGVKITAFITAVIAAFAFLSPFAQEVRTNGGIKEIIAPRFLQINYIPLWVSLGIAVVSIIVLFILAKMRKAASYEVFIERTTALTVLFSMGLGFYFFASGRANGPEFGKYHDMLSAKFDIEDPEFYRIESYVVDDVENLNTSMLWSMSSMKSFISVLPGSSFELYSLAGLDRSVATEPTEEYYALRALTRVKYFIGYNNMIDWTGKETKWMMYDYMATQGEYDIYKSDYVLPMGFAYDEYYLEKDITDAQKVDNIMVRAAIISEEQAERYSDILKKLDDITAYEYPPEESAKDEDSDDTVGIIDDDGEVEEEIDIEEILANDALLNKFKEDAKVRIAEGVTQFSVNKKGFTAVSDYDTEKLVCFSVPWCKGWSATVNGEPVEIDKINGGLCAIRVPKGIGEISFTYETPWLRFGIIVSIVGVCLLTVYMLFFYKIKRGKAPAEAQMP